MKYKSIFIALSLVLLIQFSANAQTIELSIEEAIETAMQNNVSIQNAKLDVAYAETQVNEIKAQGLPQVSGSASFSHNLQIATQVLPDFISPSVYGVLFEEGVIAPKEIQVNTFPAQFGVPYNINAGVGVNQLLFDGTFFLGLKAASEFVNISTLTASKSEIDVREGVMKAYYMALISDQNMGELDKSLTNIKKLKDETEALYKAGYAEQLDVDRLVLAINNLEINITQLKNQARLAEQLLLNAIGIDINQEVTLTSSLPSLEDGDFTDDFGLSFDATQRIEYKMLQQQQGLNQLNYKRYKMGYIPSLYGNFNYGQSTFANKGSFGDIGKEWFPASSYAFTLNVPIFDGLYKKAKMDQMKIEMQKTDNTIKQMTLGMSLEVSQARTQYINALEKLKLQENNKKLAESIYKTTAVKFKEGIGSSFELINAESDVTESKTNYLNALYDLNVAKINLTKALGTL